MVIVNCALVGDTCGKSCMVDRWFNNKYRPLFVPPTRINECKRTKEVDGNQCDLVIKDISSTRKTLFLLECSIAWDEPGAEVLLLCFSIESIDSFQNVRDRCAAVRKVSNAPIILVGTKLDVRSKFETVTYNQGIEMAQEIGATMYLECSSATGEGVDNVFDNAARTAATFKVGLKTKSCLIQ